MFKGELRKGYVTVSVELPREVADLLAERQGDLVSIIETLGRECRHLPLSSEVRAEENRLCEQKARKRKIEFRNLGRVGYRKLRQAGFSGSLQRNRNSIEPIAPEFGVSWQTLQIAIEKFKRELDGKRRQRRGREIKRLYWNGKSNGEIAASQKISRNTVTSYIRDVIKPTGRRS